MAGREVTAGPMIKGVPLEKFLEWYASRHGAEAARAVVDRLPPDLKAQLDAGSRGFGVLANAWYPAALVHHLLDDMAQELSPRERGELVEGATEAIVRSSLRGVYKILFQLFMNPTRYAARAQTLWDRYYDSGLVEKRIVAPTVHESRIEDWKSHHPLLCQMNAESARIIYEELGCARVQVERLACVSRGDDACALRIAWAG